METTASKAWVGGFTLAVFAAGFLFIYWLARAGDGGEIRNMTVRFTDPVAGLAAGSQVTFNGIRVGSVRTVFFDVDDPEVVVAKLDVNSDAPVKTDTKAFLNAQSLTGVVVVGLTGGSKEAPSIWQGSDDPVLEAENSGIGDLIANARRTLGRIDAAVETIEKLLSANASKVTSTIDNVEQFTAALADNSDDIGTLVESVSTASKALANVAEPLQRMVERGDKIVAAVDPEAVRQTVADIQNFMAGLGESRESITASVARFAEISSDVAAFSSRLGAIVDTTQGLLTAVGGRAEEILAAIEPELVGTTLKNISEISGAIEPEQVRKAVDGIAAVSSTLGNRKDDIDATITKLASVAGDVNDFSKRLPAMGEKFDGLLAAVDAEKLGKTVDNLAAISDAIEPEQVRKAVTGIADVAGALGSRKDEIDTLITRLASVAVDIDGFSKRLPAIGEKVDGLLAAVDAEKIGSTIDNANKFAAALGAQSDDLEVIMADAKEVAAGFRRVAASAESLLGTLDQQAGSEAGKGLIAEAKATLQSVRIAADTFSRQAESVGGGMSQFANRGLRDLQNFIRAGQLAVGRLDRVISNMEQNPGQFVFGGERRVPRYSVGNRR
ncbi:MAG: MlaD family protein [Alphaproteobacteria bacterium]